MGSPSRFGASLYAFLSITFWGVSFVSTKAVLGSLDPFSLLVIRFGIGAIFLLLMVLLFQYPLKIHIKYLPHVLILGVLGVFVHQVIQATALLTIHASDAGWLISFSPVFTVFLSFIFLQEKLTLKKVSGITIAVAGVLIITTIGSGQSFSFSLSLGYLLMIVSTLNWAVYSVLLKKLSVPVPSLVLTFYMSTTGFFLTLPFFIRNHGMEQLLSLSPEHWAHLLFLGIFVSAIAYWYWAKALEVMQATQVSVFLYFEPLATLIAAIILLNEKFIASSLFGGLLIIAGVMLVQGRFPFRKHV
ncbi:DMT family transporter [Halobacillus sp. GSS1]|uniref:DMT family transporter n=1 Tax=Halobacillus sp. GSS1 TaxID=2815919 RepID=UPI001A8E6355|nr:DMT family transporter [Halobacillus sp. GSS1]MBN9656301.1 DMT family transporter [Halobacillus sp. GSS1]